MDGSGISSVVCAQDFIYIFNKYYIELVDLSEKE